ncbi:RNA-binding protein 25-like [Actinia tenebrosa]|uniref:RNA-binding protein 25-like n=1 Tax=Actinia tenebrosa TaxID=6105 RepID=A0A6P8HAW8_ACTTE|nr:RNA-binding protein 25-like [Actinia tenebrosa]
MNSVFQIHRRKREKREREKERKREKEKEKQKERERERKRERELENVKKEAKIERQKRLFRDKSPKCIAMPI